MGSELLQSCISLINEQHLQRQGWLAVVANLENIARYYVLTALYYSSYVDMAYYCRKILLTI